MNNVKDRTTKSSSGGFSLIEISVVITLSSLLLVSGISLLNTWMAQLNLSTNQQRLNAIHQAFLHYQAQNNRLPCPSSFLPSDPNFGREIVKNGCTAAYIPNGTDTFLAHGRKGPLGPNGTKVAPTTQPIVIGAIPVRDLGLPDAYRSNAYGYMYTYAVTQPETTSLNAFGGAIDVVDNTGASLTPYASDNTTPGTAIYVVVDHGKDGKGAYTGAATGPGIPCAAAGSTQDSYNCHYAGAAPLQFHSAPFSQQAGLNWFDDMIVYDSALSTTPRTCTTIWSNSAAGTSTGHTELGNDVGWEFSVGAIFAYWFTFIDQFTYGTTPGPGYNAAATVADAYCTSGSYVLTGGCTQTNGPPVNGGIPINAAGTNGPMSNIYMADLSPITGIFLNSYSQLILPPASHPIFPVPSSGPFVGRQGWECDGTSSTGMYTQVYAICCTGGGG